MTALPRFCTCANPRRTIAEGVPFCDNCDERLPTPTDVLLLQVLRRLESLEGLISTERTDELATSPAGLVDAKTVARRLNRERSWVYAHADELGAIRIGTGPRPRCLFNLEQIEARLASCSTGSRADDPGIRTAKPRRSARRRSPAGTDSGLLPIRGSKDA